MPLDEKKVTQIDIRGKVCPMTFVYTKLALEKLGATEILEVLLDFPAALKNIPNSCERQSLAEVIEKKEIDPSKNEWVLILKRL